LYKKTLKFGILFKVFQRSRLNINISKDSSFNSSLSSLAHLFKISHLQVRCT